MGSIDITTYKNTFSSFQQLRTDLLTCLGDHAFAASEATICFHVLHCLKYDFQHGMPATEQEIHQGCQEIKKDFEQVFGRWEGNLLSIPSPSIFQQFLFNFFSWDSLPGRELEKLEEIVKQDLSRRQATLDYYAQTDYIKKLKASGDKPSDHQQKIEHSFYVKNLEETTKITSHLLHGIKTRALEKVSGPLFRNHSFFNSFYDRPYLTSFEDSDKYFHHEKIDKVSHRTFFLEYDAAKAISPLYAAEKDKFYAEYFGKIPPTDVFRYCHYYMDKVSPLLDNRKPLFTELFELFELKKWYGFYSLALSQIEGLFSEMMAKAFPKKPSKGSLPDKVHSLRSSYANADLDFDYYEYYIPIQRNKFMHAGFDTDIELKSYDILTDLLHLLYVYASLSVPIIQLAQIIKHPHPQSYFNEDGFNLYFDLVEDSKTSPDYKGISAEMISFERDFLSPHFTSILLPDEFSRLIPQSIAHLRQTIKDFTSQNSGSAFDLNLWTNHSITTKPDKVIELLSRVYSEHEDIFLQVESYRLFLQRFEQYLPSLPDTAKQTLSDLYNMCKDDLTKVKNIITHFEKAKATDVS